MQEVRKAPGSTMTTGVLLLSVLVVGMGQTVVFAVSPMLGRKLELQNLVVSLPWGGEWAPRELAITSLSALTALVFSWVTPKWGRLSDRIGRKPVLMIGMLGYTVGTLLFNTAAWLGLQGILSGVLLYAALLVTRLMHASVMSAANPAAAAYMADITSVATRIQGISRMASAGQIGAMLGPALAYFTVVSFLAPMYLQSVICVLCAIAIWWILPEPAVEKESDVGGVPGLPQKKLGVLDPRYREFLGIGIIVFTCLGMVQQTLGFYFQDVLLIDGAAASRLFSYAMMLCSACMILSQLVIGQRMALSPLMLMRIGLPFCVTGYALLAFAEGEALLFSGMAFFGLGIGLLGPSYSAGASLRVNANEQGALAGLLGAVAGLGFVIGPLLGGALYRTGHMLPYAVACGLSLLLGAYSWLGTTSETSEGSQDNSFK